MTESILRQLALKDLYMMRWLLVASVAAGLLSVAVAPLGPTAFYAGSIGFICVLIILNVFVVMSGVLHEKRDKVLVFLLSLPISTTGYWMVKMATNVTTFFVPWLVLTAAGVAVIEISDIPDSLTPIMLATSVWILCYYCVLLAVAVTTESLALTTTVIVAGNVSVNFFIPLVFRLPSARASVPGPVAAWGADIVATLALEAAFCAVTLAVAAFVQSRKRDFI